MVCHVEVLDRIPEDLWDDTNKIYTDALRSSVQKWPELNNFFVLHFLLEQWDRGVGCPFHKIVIDVMQSSGMPFVDYARGRWWDAFCGAQKEYCHDEAKRLLLAGVKKLCAICPSLVPADYSQLNEDDQRDVKAELLLMIQNWQMTNGNYFPIIDDEVDRFRIVEEALLFVSSSQ